MTKKKRVKTGYATDEQGRFMTGFTDEQVYDKVNEAIGHPDAQLLVAVYLLHGEPHVKVNGPPTHVVLEVMQGVTEGLRKYIEGH